MGSADSKLFKSLVPLHCSMQEQNLVLPNLLPGGQLVHLVYGCFIFRSLTYVMQSGDINH